MDTWQHLDTLNKLLLSALASVTSALGILWRALLKERRQRDLEHHEHLEDVKQMSAELREIVSAKSSTKRLPPFAP